MGRGEAARRLRGQPPARWQSSTPQQPRRRRMFGEGCEERRFAGASSKGAVLLCCGHFRAGSGCGPCPGHECALLGNTEDLPRSTDGHLPPTASTPSAGASTPFRNFQRPSGSKKGGLERGGAGWDGPGGRRGAGGAGHRPLGPRRPRVYMGAARDSTEFPHFACCCAAAVAASARHPPSRPPPLTRRRRGHFGSQANGPLLYSRGFSKPSEESGIFWSFLYFRPL